MLQNLIIPERLMGHVIGQGHKNLNTIQTKTGVALKVIDNKLHINAEATEREEKLAVREIRELVVCSSCHFKTAINVRNVLAINVEII